jgi:hypothetical protein
MFVEEYKSSKYFWEFVRIFEKIFLGLIINLFYAEARN